MTVSFLSHTHKCLQYALRSRNAFNFQKLLFFKVTISVVLQTALRRLNSRPLQQRKATSCMKNEHTVLLTCHKPDSWNMISQKSEQEQNLFPAHEGVKSNTVKRPVKEQELQYCAKVTTSHSFYLGRWVASGRY